MMIIPTTTFERMRNFYLLSSLVNVVIIALSGQIVFPLIEKMATNYVSHYLETSIFVDYGFYFYVFIFWWIAPFSIFLVKDYTKHLLYFIAVSMFWGIVILISSLKYDIETILYDTAVFMAPSIFISILIYFSQLVIGKKFLPALYK